MNNMSDILARIADKSVTVAENEQRVFEAGEKSEYDRFWDGYQDNGNKKLCAYMFSGTGWNEETLRPKYDIKPTNAVGIFSFASETSAFPRDLMGHFEKIGRVLDFSQATQMISLFNSNTAVEKIGVISTISSVSLSYIFSGCTSLKHIEKLILKDDGSQAINSLFNSSPNIEHLIIEGTIGQNGFNIQWSTKLSHESLMSIINALKDYSADTSGTTWLVTLGSENLAKLTADEKLIARNKGWELA